MIASLQDLVRMESGSANLAGVGRVADFAQARLQALGAQTERLKGPDSERVMVKGVLKGSGKLKYPYGVAVDGDGCIVVCDNNNHRLLVLP